MIYFSLPQVFLSDPQYNEEEDFASKLEMFKSGCLTTTNHCFIISHKYLNHIFLFLLYREIHGV